MHIVEHPNSTKLTSETLAFRITTIVTSYKQPEALTMVAGEEEELQQDAHAAATMMALRERKSEERGRDTAVGNPSRPNLPPRPNFLAPNLTLRSERVLVLLYSMNV